RGIAADTVGGRAIDEAHRVGVCGHVLVLSEPDYALSQRDDRSPLWSLRSPRIVPGEGDMSRLFGPLRQMGYVVPDVEAAMQHWVEVCGVGPWFYAERLPLTSFRYGGQRYDDIHLSIALANSGEVQIELIQQRSDHPSMGRDFLVGNPKGGLQHWSSWP